MPKAINSVAMRQKNEKMILSLINRHPISRVDIAKETGLTKAAVSIITDELIKRGIIFETPGLCSKNAGRTPTFLDINKESVYVVGVNVTRFDITVGLADISGNVIKEKRFLVNDPKSSAVVIGDSIKEIIETSDIDSERIYKIGLVTPGPVNTELGYVLNPPKFQEWHNCNIVDLIRERTDLEICFENVANGTALAEKYFGAAKDISRFVSLKIDEGIGSGIVVDNTLFSELCEVGHISIKYDGVLCECGNSGCFEKYASVPEIIKGTHYSSWKDLVDNEDVSIIKKEASYIQTVITTVNNIFNLDAAVLCGDISYNPDLIVGYISDSISEKMLSSKPFRILSGTVHSKTLVAASVAVGNFFGMIE